MNYFKKFLIVFSIAGIVFLSGLHSVTFAQISGGPEITTDVPITTGTVFSNGVQSSTFNQNISGNPTTTPTQNSSFTSTGTDPYYISTTTGNVSTGNVGCPTSVRTLGQLLKAAACFINKLIIPLLFTVALAGFIYGVVTYVINAGNSEKRTEGSQFMIWGIVALFVMISVWALVGVVTNTFGLNYATYPTMPVPVLK